MGTNNTDSVNILSDKSWWRLDNQLLGSNTQHMMYPANQSERYIKRPLNRLHESWFRAPHLDLWLQFPSTLQKHTRINTNRSPVVITVLFSPLHLLYPNSVQWVQFSHYGQQTNHTGQYDCIACNRRDVSAQFCIYHLISCQYIYMAICWKVSIMLFTHFGNKEYNFGLSKEQVKPRKLICL